MPAQPPFLTTTRTTAIGRSALPRMSLMRVAAASVSRMTWGRGRGLAIVRHLLSPGSRPGRRSSLTYINTNPGLGRPAATSPHVEHDPGLVRHPARLPGRIPNHVDRDRADA